MLGLAAGQLAASSATILAASAATDKLGTDRQVNLTFVNTGDSTETVIVTVSRTSGTARQIARFALSTHESFQIANYPLDPGDVVSSYTTNASVVDYDISQAPVGGPLAFTALDANGAQKVSATSFVGNNDFTARLTTTDGVTSGTAKVIGGRAYSAVSASDTVTAATSNNAFTAHAQTYTIKANSLKLNSVLKCRALVRVSDASGTDTLSVEILLGSTALIVTTAVNPGATTDLHILEFELTARAAPGAAASVVGFGRWVTNTGGTIAHGTGLLGATNFATNGDLILSVASKWSSNTANTAAILEALNVEIL